MTYVVSYSAKTLSSSIFLLLILLRISSLSKKMSIRAIETFALLNKLFTKLYITIIELIDILSFVIVLP